MTTTDAPFGGGDLGKQGKPLPPEGGGLGQVPTEADKKRANDNLKRPGTSVPEPVEPKSSQSPTQEN